jgi:hypothetical protein
MFKYFSLISMFSITLYASMLPFKIAPEKIPNEELDIKILDAKELQFPNVHELSALAFKNDRLYALSDKGILYLFEIDLHDDKIEELSLLERHELTNKKSKRFTKKKRDSEGLAFYKKGFLISFERKNRVLYCSREGKKIKKMALNALLEKNENYVSPNKGLESVAYSERYGLVTIPEQPLVDEDKRYHTLYAKDRIWKFQAQGAVTDIEFIDTKKLLVLLREYSYLSNRHITSLVAVDLENCNEQRVCKSQLLAKLDSKKGWKIDNFEGLTKVAKNKFLMVSDDNDSMFQKTLLVLFEIKR